MCFFDRVVHSQNPPWLVKANAQSPRRPHSPPHTSLPGNAGVLSPDSHHSRRPTAPLRVSHCRCTPFHRELGLLQQRWVNSLLGPSPLEWLSKASAQHRRPIRLSPSPFSDVRSGLTWWYITQARRHHHRQHCDAQRPPTRSTLLLLPRPPPPVPRRW